MAVVSGPRTTPLFDLSERDRMAQEARHAAATRWPQGDSWVRGYALDVPVLLAEIERLQTLTGLALSLIPAAKVAKFNRRREELGLG
jgi:hypothetical protein